LSYKSDPALQAVLFDLDDTLLYNDMEGTFLNHYFSALTGYARDLCPPEELLAALAAGVQAVQESQDPDGPTNEASFGAVFAARLGHPWDELHAMFARFYEERFPALRVHTRAHPDGRRTVQACLDAGYAVVIATNPLFPRRAIEHRLAWAGVDDLSFALITSYETMHTSKPYPAYYREIAARIGVVPRACLMVGNDLVRDILPAQQAGMRTYLAEDWITNPDPEIDPDRRGTLGELIEWIENSHS
jgi:FMN phosphatase YigB (HAD superfamily)